MPAVIKIEDAPEGNESEAEEIQANEHEAQEAEGEQWRSALSSVTDRLVALSEQIATQGNRISPELATLLETQREMIASLQASNATQAQQLQEIVDKYLLTQPRQSEEVTPTVMTLVEPAAAEPQVDPGVPVVEETRKRYRAL